MIAGKSLWSVNGPWNDDKKVNVRRIGNFSFSPSVCLSICSSLSVFLSVCPSIWLSLAISLSLRRTVCLSLWLSLFRSVCLAVYSFIWLSIALSLSVWLSVSPSLRLPVCLSVSLSVYLSIREFVCLAVALTVRRWVLTFCMVLTLTNFGNTIPALMAYSSMSSLRAANKKKTFLRHLFTSLKDYKTFLRWRNTNLPVIE